MITAVVTGSQSGMGLAIRTHLEAQGWRVLGVDLPGHGSEIEADLSTAQGRQQAIETILNRCDGVLDALVCNAGVDTHNIKMVFAVNFDGTIDLMEGLQPALARGPYASAVLNISNSIHITPNIPMEPVDALLSGRRAEAEESLREIPERAYQVSKFALARWMRRHAPGERWAGAGIRVNAICPGPVLTELLKKDLNDPVKREAILGLPQPLGQFTTPEAIAEVVSFLLGTSARFLVGQMLMVDGGMESMLRAEEIPLVWRR